jgi:hypothetical protein
MKLKFLGCRNGNKHASFIDLAYSHKSWSKEEICELDDAVGQKLLKAYSDLFMRLEEPEAVKQIKPKNDKMVKEVLNKGL